MRSGFRKMEEIFFIFKINGKQTEIIVFLL